MFLSLNNFQISYSDFKVIIPSLDLEVGSTTAVVGNNGSGKTTFIEGILGVQPNVSGTKRWRTGYEELDKINSGVQLQRSGFGNEMLVEDICLLHRTLYQRQEDTLFLALAIEELVKKQYKNLSRGQKQRVDLFVAIAHKPSQLFLDEPTAGLDASFARIFIELFTGFSNNGNNSVIYACHDPKEFSLANKVLWLEKGLVKDFGDKQTLFKAHLGDFKVEFIGITKNQVKRFVDEASSSQIHTSRFYKQNDGALTLYGSIELRAWAENKIRIEKLQNYAISPVGESDFLDYLTTKDSQC